MHRRLSCSRRLGRSKEVLFLMPRKMVLFANTFFRLLILSSGIYWEGVHVININLTVNDIYLIWYRVSMVKSFCVVLACHWPVMKVSSLINLLNMDYFPLKKCLKCMEKLGAAGSLSADASSVLCCLPFPWVKSYFSIIRASKLLLFKCFTG